MNLTLFRFPQLAMLMAAETIHLSSYSWALAASARGSSSSDDVNPSAIISNGILNLGNTCYINAQLQCAFHIPYIRSLILDRDRPEVEESPGLLGLRTIFAQMLDSTSTTSSTPTIKRPASTAVFCRCLGINPMEQQDAQEFWKLLLPELQLPKLLDLYSGSYEDYIVACDNSGRERRREEPFLDLSLEVTPGSVMTSMKQMFNEPELLSVDEGNGWRPEKNAEKVDALKGQLLRAHGLPSLLQLHLKRFRYDWQTDTTSKLNDRFVFPKELYLKEVCTDIQKEDERLAKYDLQSVVVHVGHYGSGHYYTYCRPDFTKDQWFRFDDDRVTPVDYSDVIADAYGGRASVQQPGEKRRLRWFGGGGNRQTFGFGGKESCAYMLQYVRKCDVPLLYGQR